MWAEIRLYQKLKWWESHASYSGPPEKQGRGAGETDRMVKAELVTSDGHG